MMFQRINDYSNVHDALVDLCRNLVEVDVDACHWQSVKPEEMPEAYRKLLVHHDHMTTVLSKYHNHPVELKVLQHEINGDVYRRKIILAAGEPENVVEFGIVRIDLRFTPDAVREAIIERKTPLGDILIQHNVLRRIDPRWYIKIPAGSELLRDLQHRPEHEVFGRVGTIYCDDQPALELLEVVMNG